MGTEKTSAVIVAAGSGVRMGIDKMLAQLCGKSVIERTVEVFSECNFVDEIVVVSSEKNLDTYTVMLKKFDNVKIVLGGKSRGESVINGLKEASGEFVLVHDGARPLITKEIIASVLKDAETYGAAACAVPCKDSIKSVDEDGFIRKTVERKSVVLMQTPQCFKREELINAYENSLMTETDDCEVAEKMGISIKITEGSYENIKLTTADDMITAASIINKRNTGEGKMRIGTGFDSHRLTENRKLIIGGVEIPFEKGLLGHSDADVLLHAIIDALLGSMALGDIGTHFPDSDDRYKGISSLVLLEKTAELVEENGYTIENIDSTIIIQQPKMAPFIEKMRENIANSLKIDVSQVSVKAKTNEKMGFTGTGEGVEARATVLIK